MHQKTVLVTGCFSGIGRSTAPDFLDEEWEVYAIARNPVDIEALGEHGANVVTLDVTNQGDVDRVADRIVDEQGRIGCLIDNAGYDQMDPTEDVSTEKVHNQFDVSIYGPHQLVRVVSPHMRSQNDGIIVDVSSIVGRITFPDIGAYAGSKFVLEAMIDALRTEVEEYGIDAVLVKLDPVETQFSNRVETGINGNGDEIDGLDHSGMYEKFYKPFDDSQTLGGNGSDAISSERVTKDIVNAVSSAKPRARYQSGTVIRTSVLARFLPDAWRDALYGFARKLP